MNEEYEKAENINKLFSTLNSNNIDYVLIKNLNNELPEKLKISKDIDIIVNEKDMEKFHKIMRGIGRKVRHPYCSINGWNNLYDLPEFEFWRLFNGSDLYVDVTYRLCCRSLMPKTWIPLDDIIQKYLWKNKQYDEKNEWWILDINTRYIYYLVRCIYDKEKFTDVYLLEIEKAKKEINVDVVTRMLNCVFFGFTPIIIRMIEERRFNEIRNEYLRFQLY